MNKEVIEYLKSLGLFVLYLLSSLLLGVLFIKGPVWIVQTAIVIIALAGFFALSYAFHETRMGINKQKGKTND